MLNQNKVIQPIYIIGNIDGDDVSRKNVREEIETMERLYEQINRRGGNSKLLPVIYFDPTKYYSPSIQNATDWIYKEKGFTRNKNQYSAMLTTCIALNKRIEICSENEPGARFAQYIKRLIEKNKQTPAQLYAKWLRFPLLYTNKKQMLKTARKSGWEDILHQTFSCWFPVDGKACGKCKMCRERII
uniref:Queuosine biosynthesis protein n=1 Tax=Iridovirus LCIVAC01 TaxID=2506607 RepID=A0A481YRY8_9VIRU|nr:MAG: queuosine biosynthesis protein [Iridovirus LCIVAC01]